MKKTVKRVISLIMVVVICSTSFFGLSANATVTGNDYEYNNYPLIVVRGFDILSFAYGNGEETLKINIPEIISVVSKFLFQEFFFMKDDAMDTLLAYVNKLFGPIASDNKGEPIYKDVHIPQFNTSTANFDISSFGKKHAQGLIHESVDQLGAENVYVFTFDWRKTPDVYARELDELIEIAKEETGKDKVNIAATSMGAVALTAYFNYIGYDKIDSAVILSGVQNGSDLAGKLFTGKIEIKKETVVNFVDSLVANQSPVVKILLKIAGSIGIYDLLINIVSDVLVDHQKELYDGFLRNTFATAPGMWALCPDEYFDKGLEYIFDGVEDEYAVVIEKIKGLRDFIFSTEKILSRAYEEDIKLSYVSNYGLGLVPIYEGSDTQGDVVVSTYITSNFAKVAPYGKQLSNEELAGVAPEFISPDKSVDASVCLYPEYTWFVKNAIHVGCSHGSEFARFAIMLATGKSQPTVYDNELYPRFLEVDENQNFIR